MTPPTFQTERLRLRAISAADIPAIQRHFNDYEVIRHLSSRVPWPYPDDGAETFVRDVILPNQGRDRWSWGIFLNGMPGDLVGMVELWKPGQPENRGFWLGRKFWGRGLMSEALVPVTDWAFDQLGFEVLVFENARGNMASARLKEKFGATLVRVQPGSYVDAAYTESEIWELPKCVWKSRRAR